MIVIYVLMLILVSELLHMIAVHQQFGVNPHPLGTTICCYIAHFILLILNVWYCGWLVGIIVSACEFFSIIHMTVGWIITIPTLFVSNPEKQLKIILGELKALPYSMIALFIFLVVSLFLVPYAAAVDAVIANENIIVYGSSAIVALFILRIMLTKWAFKSN